MLIAGKCVAGWTSGRLSESGGCGFLAEEEEHSWMFSAALLCTIGIYLFGGAAMKKLQGRSTSDDWLPNHGFWSSVCGLVIDGVYYTANGGVRIQPEPLLPKPVPDSTSLQTASKKPEPTSRPSEPLFTMYIEKYGDENQQELKDVLEQQGTAAARLGLKQLEVLVLKQQLEKLGLPNTGSKVELETRLREATKT